MEESLLEVLQTEYEICLCSYQYYKVMCKYWNEIRKNNDIFNAFGGFYWASFNSFIISINKIIMALPKENQIIIKEKYKDIIDLSKKEGWKSPLRILRNKYVGHIDKSYFSSEEINELFANNKLSYKKIEDLLKDIGTILYSYNLPLRNCNPDFELYFDFLIKHSKDVFNISCSDMAKEIIEEVKEK